MVVGEPRHICVYAMSSLKKNSTRLLVVMCIGIALGAYGIYVQARSQSNMGYVPTITMATRWMANRIGYKLMHPNQMMQGCGGMMSGKGGSMHHHHKSHSGFGHFLMRFMVGPIVANSGMMNLMINVVQIVILKVYCKSIIATDVMIGMSAAGLLISMICMFGSFATCKLMCISCLGLQHVAIIYFAVCRRKIIQNLMCGIGGGGSGSNRSGASGSCSTGVPTNSSNNAQPGNKKKPEKYSS